MPDNIETSHLQGLPYYDDKIRKYQENVGQINYFEINKFLNKESNILEINAGDGYTANKLREMGYNIIATDLQDPTTSSYQPTVEASAHIQSSFQNPVHVEELEATEAVKKYNNIDVLLSESPTIKTMDRKTKKISDNSDWLRKAIENFDGNVIIIQSLDFDFPQNKGWEQLFTFGPEDYQAKVYVRPGYLEHIKPEYLKENHKDYAAESDNSAKNIAQATIQPLSRQEIDAYDQLFTETYGTDYNSKRNFNGYGNQQLDQKIANRHTDDDVIMSNIVRNRLAERLKESNKYKQRNSNMYGSFMLKKRYNTAKNNLDTTQNRIYMPNKRQKNDNNLLNNGVMAQARKSAIISIR